MAQYNGIVAALVMRDASQKNADYISLLDEALRNYSNMEISLRDTCLDSNGVNRADSIESPADSCSTLLQIIAGHKRELLKNNDDIISTKTANLQQYYDKYLDGQINKTPQLAPIFSYLTSDKPWENYVFRMPIEWLEMLLLVLIGVIGGLIGVIKSFVDRSRSDRPLISEYFYRPAVGAVVALAPFVLFRAGQILLGNENPSGTVTGATGLFLLAFLGLVSGLRAKDVIDQLEAGFFRVFPRESGAKIEARAEP